MKRKATPPRRRQVLVRLMERDWLDLRRLAEERALREGGPASIAAMVGRLVREAAARCPFPPRAA